MRKVLIVGGSNGVGLGMASVLAERETCERVYIVDKSEVCEGYDNAKFECIRFDLNGGDYSLFDRFDDVDTLIITAGFGRLALFRDMGEEYITSSFNVNAVAPIRIIKRFYDRLERSGDFYCAVMVSIAGYMSSPFFSVYGATKAALRVFIESVNVELVKAGSRNRILNVSPGSLQGTGFYDGRTDLSAVTPMARAIIERMERRDDLFIPRYEETYKAVLARYNADFRAEGLHSYEYKAERIRGQGR
ncbi:MAG: SDR family NAD(P)-dependent oxidoreductase [Prevotella sp.]|nr:SDR family NAD(P)-dependent oxidoreductase [Prevotella sp.]